MIVFNKSDREDMIKERIDKWQNYFNKWDGKEGENIGNDELIIGNEEDWEESILESIQELEVTNSDDEFSDNIEEEKFIQSENIIEMIQDDPTLESEDVEAEGEEEEEEDLMNSSYDSATSLMLIKYVENHKKMNNDVEKENSNTELFKLPSIPSYFPPPSRQSIPSSLNDLDSASMLQKNDEKINVDFMKCSKCSGISDVPNLLFDEPELHLFECDDCILDKGPHSSCNLKLDDCPECTKIVKFISQRRLITKFWKHGMISIEEEDDIDENAIN